MPDSITTFFDSWALSDASERLAKIASSTTNGVKYDDPQTPNALTGVDALSEYVGMFSANAPGWSAKVVKNNVTNGVTLATVAFGGPGPDGTEKIQYGQYFVETEGDLISRIVGFVGTGAPE